MEIKPFTQSLPEKQTAPVVINSPHSGAYYPASFLEMTRLSNLAIRSSEDFLVDELVVSATSHGMPLLAANLPRAYLDLNREPYELDSTIFDGPLPTFANRQSIRVTGGLGTIPKIVANGLEIYSRLIPVSEAFDRITKVYRPYHNTLQSMLAKTHVGFGVSVLLDIHSMPSTGNAGIPGEKADIVLGDRYGTSCTPEILHHAKSIFEAFGYAVAINRPYAGGFITEHYGRPHQGLHALQVEINRALYMN